MPPTGIPSSQPADDSASTRTDREELQRLIASIDNEVAGAVVALRRAPDGALSVLFASPVVEEVSGISQRELARDATPLLQMIHADDQQRVLTSFTESAERLATWRSEFRVNTPTKGPMCLEARLVPWRQPDGSIDWYGSLTGITARNLSELELRRSRQLLEAFIDHAPVGIAMFNRNLRYIRSSRRWQEVMTASDATLSGRHHYEDQTEIPDKWKDAHRRGLAGETVQGEDEWLRPDGKHALHHWEVHPWGDDGVDTGGIIIMFEDVTEARAMEAELRHAHKMEALGQLAGGVAHDFNNLLQIIQGYTELLKDQLDGNNLALRYAADVLNAAHRASSLTRQLLAFSRRQVFSPEVIDLNDVVRSTSKMLKRLLGEDIDYCLELAQPLWAVQADGDQLSQVLINLCVNARDAMPRGGRLTVATRNQLIDGSNQPEFPGCPPGEYVILTVRDTGSGMDATVLEHIFEPFFTTKEAGKGTGLGLSTVYGIVRQSEGFVWADSAPGRGSCFTVALPRTGRVATEEATLPSLDSMRSNLTVLLVEDDPDVRSSVAEYLPTLGYSVITADPAQAMALAAAHPGAIDVLLTDVVMPDMSGPVLAEQLRAIRPGLRTVYMSGYIDDAVTRHGVLESKDPFLQKPFTLSELAEAIREAVSRP